MPSIVHCQISANFEGTIFYADTARSLSLGRHSFERHGEFDPCAALPGTEFEGLWHNSEIVGPGCHRLDPDHGFLYSMVSYGFMANM